MAGAFPGVPLGHLCRLLEGQAASSLSDAQLLQRFTRDRDETAFAALVQRHGALVLGVCRRILHHQQDAEDAFQATFLTLARRAGSVRWRESVGGWLHRVAYRIAGRARRDAGRRRALERQATRPDRGDALAEITGREMLALLDEGLLALPDKYRTPLVLCYLEGKTQDEAARWLGWPRGTLKARLERGRALLHRQLTRRGVALSAPLLAAGVAQPTHATTVAPALLAATVRAGTLLAAGKGVEGISVRAIALSDQALSLLAFTPAKIGAAVIFLAGILAAIGWAAFQTRPAHPSTAATTFRGPAAPGAGIMLRPGPRPERVDDHGDPLPEGALARLGTLRFRIANQLGFYPISPDGKIMAVGADDGIHFWDLATGQTIRKLTGGHRAEAMQFSSDGQTLVSREPGLIRVWDVATGRQLRQLETGQVVIQTNTLFYLTPDGQTLIAGEGEGSSETFKVWDLATGRERWRREGFPIGIMAWSADGRTLIGGQLNGPAVLFLETATGRELRRVDVPIRRGSRLASPDLQVMVVKEMNDPTIRLVDLNTGRELRRLAGQPDAGMPKAFSEDGKILATTRPNTRFRTGDATCRLWEVATGEELRRLEGPLGQALWLAWTGNQTVAFGLGNETALRFWDLARNEEVNPTAGHRGHVFGLAFTPDGRRLISAGRDNTVRCWDPATRQELHQFGAGHVDGIHHMTLAPDGRTLLTGSFLERQVRRWDAVDGRESHRLPLAGWLRCLAWSPTDEVVAAGLASSAFTSVAGRLVPGNLVQFLDPADGREFGRWETPADTVAFSPDGKLLAAAGSSSLAVWEVEARRERGRYAWPDHTVVRCVAFSPDGQTLAIGGGQNAAGRVSGRLTLWDVTTGMERQTITTLPKPVECVAFSLDGRLLAAGTADNHVRLWDAATGEELRRLRGHQNVVCSVAFAPDGRTLASGSYDSTVLVWSIADVPDHP
jgi:RNA polymerase sigma factor (sigma-70 family)